MFSKRLTIALGTLLFITACANESTRSGPQSRDGNRPPPRGQERGGRQQAPDLSEAAETLGISEDELLQALRDAGGPPPDLAKAAEALGITEEELKDALPERRRRR